MSPLLIFTNRLFRVLSLIKKETPHPFDFAQGRLLFLSRIDSSFFPSPLVGEGGRRPDEGCHGSTSPAPTRVGAPLPTPGEGDKDKDFWGRGGGVEKIA